MEMEERKTLHELYPQSNYRLTKEDLSELESKGIPVIVNKRFTAEEDKRIVKNFKRFFKKHGIQIDDEVKTMALGYFYRSKNPSYRKKKKEMDRFLKKHKFLLKLGKGLYNRTIRAIYQRARKVVSPLRTSGDLTKEERNQIVKVKKKDYAMGWTEIGELFGADPKVIHEVVDSTIDKKGNQLRKGVFDINEQICLANGILKVTDCKDIYEAINTPISWEEVSKHVNNRSAKQCRKEWLKLSTQIESYVKPYILDKPYTDLDSARLIYILYKDRMKYDNFSDIDWDWIKSKFSHVGPLDVIIRWWKSLAYEVPMKHEEPYFKLVKWLYRKKLPLLMRDTTYEQLEEFYNESSD